MDFDSLLPNNFNSYLFNFTHNLDMATQYRKNIPYHSAVINKDAINGICGDFEEYMDKWAKDKGYSPPKEEVEEGRGVKDKKAEDKKAKK